MHTLPKYIGFPSGEWKYSDGWKLEEVSFTDITAATVDPYGQLLFIGSGDGHLHFVCVRTGLPLTHNLRRIRQTLELLDNSRVQTVSCALHPYNLTRDKYRLLCAAGSVSGLFQVSYFRPRLQLPVMFRHVLYYTVIEKLANFFTWQYSIRRGCRCHVYSKTSRLTNRLKD